MHTLTSPSLFRQSCYVNGQWTDAADSIDVTNPANGERLGSVPA